MEYQGSHIKGLEKFVPRNILEEEFVAALHSMKYTQGIEVKDLRIRSSMKDLNILEMDELRWPVVEVRVPKRVQYPMTGVNGAAPGVYEDSTVRVKRVPATPEQAVKIYEHELEVMKARLAKDSPLPTEATQQIQRLEVAQQVQEQIDKKIASGELKVNPETGQVYKTNEDDETSTEGEVISAKEAHAKLEPPKFLGQDVQPQPIPPDEDTQAKLDKEKSNLPPVNTEADNLDNRPAKDGEEKGDEGSVFKLW